MVSRRLRARHAADGVRQVREAAAQALCRFLVEVRGS
ncbi:hypothetical protein N599_32905 [Saccharopolyspora erythraea D]|nr:hypothetical protein N599_32905 [Saccharopolyspora erythraea D]